MGGFNNRCGDKEERISELEGKTLEISYLDQKRKKKIEKLKRVLEIYWILSKDLIYMS